LVDVPFSPTARLLIWGASGHGKVVAEVARSSGFTILGFLDDDSTRWGATWQGAVVLGGAAWLRSQTHAAAVVIAIGDNRKRERVQRDVERLGVELPSPCHPAAVVSSTCRVGPGTVVCPLAVINPDAEVGRGVIINTGAVIEHDCRVADFAHVSPNATLGGGVHIGLRTHVGLGASVLPGIHIGDDAVVGAGAVVTRPVDRGAVVLGVPARSREGVS
jgi:sugar O-acyltransferase (sialic acid O-acetyltransferase NeuD family)